VCLPAATSIAYRILKDMNASGLTAACIVRQSARGGIGFAIPVDVVNRVIPELIGKGRVPTPGIGIVTANETVATRSASSDWIGLARLLPARFELADDSGAERCALRLCRRSSVFDVLVDFHGLDGGSVDVTVAVGRNAFGRRELRIAH
jgi:hypothetical protein